MTDKIKSLIRKQEDLYDRLSKAHTNYKKSPKDRLTFTYIETKTESLDKLWELFLDGHNEIAAAIDKSDKAKLAYFEEDVYTQFEDIYSDYKTKLRDDLRARQQTSEVPSGSATARGTASYDVKLPRINLPQFSGSYEQWQNFYDMFDSLINQNNSLSAVHKLHYLKSCLSGEAETLLKNLSTTELNYTEAWNQLIRRYNNKRYNANEIMKRLFSQKNITSESPNAIKQLLDTTSACLKSLNNIHIETGSWDAIINYLIVSKLDPESRKLWELEVGRAESSEISDNLPTWEQLKKFLEMRFRALEMLEPVSNNKFTPKPSQTPTANNTKPPVKQRSFHSSVQEEKKTSYTCEMCSGQHTLYQCKRFATLSPEKRSEYIQTKGLCFNCLSTTHAVKNCHISTCCRKCGKRHHTLLHFERVSYQNSTTAELSSPEKSSTEEPQTSKQYEPKVVAHFAKESHQSRVILATAMIKIKSSTGYSQTVRALIDQGSEASFMSEATAQSLQLKREAINGIVSGIGEGETRTKNMVSFTLESLQNPTFSVPVEAFVLKKLTSYLPSRDTSIPNWPEIKNLPLADPTYMTPGKIDVILGVEVHGEILLEGLLKHPSMRGPVAQNTHLGWILSGKISNKLMDECERKVISMHIQIKEDQLLKQFWEIEREPDCIRKRMTKEEIRCEEIYEETTSRDSEGRYTVRLPFQSPNPECLHGHSEEIALKRFKSLEKRLQKDEKLHAEYKNVIEDYIDQNHMIHITDEEQLRDPYVVYLPHHAVVRNDKETTKVRIVFDASCKGVNNVSLNDNLLVGPKLQDDLRHILMRWRRYEICIVADLVKMYRQVRVDDRDTDFQRILWRSNPNEPYQHYKLLRLTFGTSCAPYLAVKSLQQLAKDEQQMYPLAAQITLQDYYMDDLLTGCETTQQAIEIYEQMNKLMKEGGFELQNWFSNSHELLKHIQEENQRSSQSVVFKSGDNIKVLGISWNKTSDQFEYHFNVPESNNLSEDDVTKRMVLSEIARLYDPMGWIAPKIVTAKIFIQKLWKSKLSWDDKLSPELLLEWQRFRLDLQGIHNLVIPRWLHCKRDDCIELHAFADASQAAYAAAVYIKSTRPDGIIAVNLITAKTKVAPVEKEISIPRMELCAALLATKLVYEVSQVMGIPKSNIYAWSDSTVVLAWIAGEPSRWTTFVSNRISEILTMLDRDQWRHVSTDQNPADIGSRGLSIRELIKHDLWWHGPTWLQRDNFQQRERKQFETTEETRAVKTLSTTVNINEEFIWNRFSNLPKMLRVLAYCKRFSNLKLPRDQRKTSQKTISTEETNNILEFCLKETQKAYFTNEITRLKSGQNITKKSPLHTLHPVFDENGILRVGGQRDDLRARQQTSEVPSGSATARGTASYDVKLPRINLPQFSGSYEQWQNFYDMFDSLINQNNSLSAVHKLHYLKSCLSGEAETLLKNLSTTELNYTEAWNQLIRRYNNKRYNANEIMKRLFSQKNITSESPNAIKQLLDTTSACLKSLNNIHIETGSWDAIINYLIVSKLDPESRKLWELEVGRAESSEISDNLPTWEQLKKFLEMRFRALEMLEPVSNNKFTPKPSQTPTANNTKPPVKQRSFHSSVQEEKKTSYTCEMCSGQHTLYQCKRFATLSPEKRSEYIQTKGLCFNCLSTTHAVKNCHISTCCRKCGKRHHTLLHFERVSYQNSTTAELSSPEKSSTEEPQTSKQYEPKVVAHFAKESHQSRVILATAMIKIKSSTGYSQTVRALIDQGSEASFMSEATAQSLQLKREAINGIVSGIGEGETRTKNMVSFTLESLQNPTFSVPVEAFVLKKLTSYLPSRDTSIPNWPEIKNLPLADPTYMTPGKIDVILGVEVHGEILLEGLLKHPSMRGPVAQNTHLGWILSGKISNKLMDERERKVISMHIQIKEDQLLKQFWEIEREPDCIRKRMTKEEIRCEEIYEETTSRDSEGRYTVRLPFQSPNPECLHGHSEEIALKRFKSLEKRLQKDEKLHAEYKNVIEDYIDQNHMIHITDEEQLRDPYVVYLPHHAVVRNDKETTKVRIVFDASCKGVNNVSLNDNLLVGPKLQDDLRHILMRWRRYEICIVADLVKMYRQVRVDDRDTDFQRILWRSNPNEPYQHYKLLRLTFGTSCAPYLAVKSLQQLAKDEQQMYPLAAQITLQDYYMDDLLTGCETTQQAIEIYEQMNKLMKEGGFELQNWFSNSHELLKHIQEENQRSSQSVVFKSGDNIKVLGISWNKTSDQFEYHFNVPESNNLSEDDVTKRMVLSEIARLYDPMGWIAPKIVTAKIFIQKLWKSKLSWDDKLSPELLLEWQRFRLDLQGIHNLVIPRWLHCKRDDCIELHAFADASQAAYAAAVYIKSTRPDGIIAVNLITAKTKVAPVEKEISIPRMELCAALLATKLVYEVSQVMGIPKSNIYAWSDSTVVLAWIAGEPSRWTTFVSNRISEILTMLDRDQWRHVSTDQNPADIGSRGLSIRELIKHDLWWHGPTWLQRDNFQQRERKQFETTEETRAVKTLSTTVNINEEFIWNRFSNLPKMLRVLAYCKRFSNLKLPRDQRKTSQKTISTEETNNILEFCLKETQKAYFTNEITRLKSGQNITKKSPLHTLHPVFDENGILRVGGRIHEAHVAYDKRHPVILPSDSHITKLIIQDAHEKTLHGGPQLMLNFLRSKYWIIRARDMVKKCYRKCITCVRYSEHSNNQLMGRLPEARLKPMRAFKISGVDFTGHINLRFSPGRGARSYKGYICLFVCLFSKAIHLEAVSDLTSKGFIAAFQRFVSRRGHCQTLYSDNGTNFVGADKELREMFDRSISQLPEELQHLLANEGTTWKFIPPQAPNFGGLWEAGVRSAKKHLKRVIGDSTLTFEELTTILTQIEACLNSRPLSYLSDNPEDPTPLTPGHFLVGEPLLIIPDDTCEENNISDLRRWKYCQKMMSDFWRKWSNEYLVTLNQRYKWTTKKSEPEVDDIVIIKDKNIPPAKWWLGRVIAKHSGKDNLTRVVSIKTKNGVTKRPCSKLCLLPNSTD